MEHHRLGSNALKVCAKLTYQARLAQDPYANAAIQAGLNQPELSKCADHLVLIDTERHELKGKWMSKDHLIQEAVKWMRAR